MSTYLSVLQDQAQALGDQLYAQNDPMQRLADANAISAYMDTLIRKIRQEAAYEARLTLSSAEIAEVLEMDRKQIDYLVRRYLEDHPHKPRPPHHSRHLIEAYVDLTTESENHPHSVGTSASQS